MTPLDGLRVLDLSRVLAGPFCGQMLADQGADIVKIEGPEGDENRRWPPLNEAGESCNYASVNRGKRNMVLNLKSAAARDILDRLVATADVLIHSFPPQTAERLGIGYERFKALNPRLVYCAISGYGDDGPMRDKPGYDLMMQAFSGIMSTTGTEDGPPIRSGVSFVDMSTGLTAYAGITTALLARQRSGKGSSVRASLLETAMALLGYHAVAWLQLGILPRKEGSGVWHLVPYQAFQCRDGHILIGAPNDAAWQRLCAALDRPELARDPRFADNRRRVENRDALVACIEARLAEECVAGWMTRMEAQGVAAAPIHSLAEALTHPQVRANGMVVEAAAPDGRALPLIGLPFKLDGVAIPASNTAPPALGIDTESVLRADLGLSPQEIAALREAGAF